MRTVRSTVAIAAMTAALVTNLLTSFAFAQSGDQPDVVIGPPITKSGGSPYDGRFAASTYRFDSGTALSAYGGTPANYDAVWVTRFDAAGGADAITSVTTPFADTAVGTTATIYIWEDPDDSGNPANRVLIATVPVEVQSQCFCSAPAFNVFPLPQPVPVRGSFFVGVKVPGKFGEYPALFEASTPYAVNRSFGRMIAAGFDPVTTPLNPFGNAASPVTWFIRANGSNSGFTYQGSLNVSGAAYTGNADLIATIYDAESGGAAMSPSFAIADVSVTNGLFSVRIPADASSFDPGADRWLELGVKRAGESGYTTLSPRQRITSVPTALAAATAARAATVPWSGILDQPAVLPPWSAVTGGINYAGGNVGIGTTGPSSPLHIVGSGGLPQLRVSASTSAAAGAILSLDATAMPGGIQWFQSSTGGGAVDGQGKLVFGNSAGNARPLTLTSDGRVGINVVNPDATLHVVGDVRLDTGYRLRFGGETENGDPIWISRFNFGTDQSGVRLELGDDNPGNGSNNDAFIITTRGTTLFQFNTQFGGQALKAGGGSWGALSDARAKHDIRPLTGTLDRLLQLQGKSYEYNDPTMAGAGPGRFTGFVAQDVERVFPQWVGATSGGMKTLSITGFEALTVESLRDLRKEKDAQIQSLQAESDRKQREIDELKARLDRLEKQMSASNR